jgi:hypothetical protein
MQLLKRDQVQITLIDKLIARDGYVNMRLKLSILIFSKQAIKPSVDLILDSLWMRHCHDNSNSSNQKNKKRPAKDHLRAACLEQDKQEIGEIDRG